MKVSLTAHPLSATVVATFGSSSESASHPIVTPSGADLWFDGNGRLRTARFAVDLPAEEASLILGPDSTIIVGRLVERLDSENEVEIEWDVPDRLELAHTRLFDEYSTVRNTPVIPSGSMSADGELLEALRGDGVPIAVEVVGSKSHMRAAHVVFPVAPGHTSLRSRNGEIAWDTSTGEMIIRLRVHELSADRLWVRISAGESGDIIALARPRTGDDGSSVGRTVVPPDVTLGDMYVDVTDDALATVGTSRYRARRRAAALEELAARTSDERVARSAMRRAREIRVSLGEPPSDGARTLTSTRRLWVVPVVLVALVGSFLLGRLGSPPASSPSPSVPSTVSSVPSTIATKETTTTILESGEGLLASGMPIESGLDVLAYDPAATAFFGVSDLSLAGREPSESDGSLEIQMYTGYEYPFRDGNVTPDQSGVDLCLNERGSNIGGDPNYLRELKIVILGFQSREDAIAALTGPISGTEIGRFDGRVAMAGTVIESCELRAASGTPKVFFIARQVYDAVRVPVHDGFSYATVRVIGDDTGWASDKVIELRS